jgi:thioredoxin reductase
LLGGAMNYDAIIVGGGPAGLAGALTLGRARKRVLLCDSGPRRNAAAVHVQNFVTRDGTPPAEFRRIAREQLEAYPNVEIQDLRADAITGARGEFHVQVGSRTVGARRVLLCTGMLDEMPEIEGFRALWGTSIFACPYCHGWEVQDRRFGLLATEPETLSFAPFLRGWSRHVTLLTHGSVTIPADVRSTLIAVDVHLDERPVARLRANGSHLSAIEFVDGHTLELDVLFAHPKQRQVPLVLSLNLPLDDKGFVRVDDMRETSVPGIYVAGDLITPAQSAVLAAASGMFAAAALNRALTIELATSGGLP